MARTQANLGESGAKNNRDTGTLLYYVSLYNKYLKRRMESIVEYRIVSY